MRKLRPTTYPGTQSQTVSRGLASGSKSNDLSAPPSACPPERGVHEASRRERGGLKRIPDLAGFTISLQLALPSCPERRSKEALRRKGQAGREARARQNPHPALSAAGPASWVWGQEEMKEQDLAPALPRLSGHRAEDLKLQGKCCGQGAGTHIPGLSLSQIPLLPLPATSWDPSPDPSLL